MCPLANTRDGHVLLVFSVLFVRKDLNYLFRSRVHEGIPTLKSSGSVAADVLMLSVLFARQNYVLLIVVLKE